MLNERHPLTSELVKVGEKRVFSPKKLSLKKTSSKASEASRHFPMDKKDLHQFR